MLLNTSLWNEFLFFNLWHTHTFQWYTLSSPWKKRMSFFISSSKAKKWSLLIFEIQFSMFFLFLRLFNTTGNEKWSFYGMGIFYIIHRCHRVSVLAYLHPIDFHCHKPHQKVFLLPTKGLVCLFKYPYGIFWYTVSHIFFLHFFYNNEEKKWAKKY